MKRNRYQLGVIVAAMLLGILVWGMALPGVRAQDLPPRPTDAPTATAKPTATARPTPKPRRHSDDDDDDEPTLLLGRITGTVIDETTGAPVPGVLVAVDAITVTTDLNGNYDRPGLADDTYAVTLLPAKGYGDPAQPTVSVMIADGATVVQHLAFLPRNAVASAQLEHANSFGEQP